MRRMFIGSDGGLAPIEISQTELIKQRANKKAWRGREKEYRKNPFIQAIKKEMEK